MGQQFGVSQAPQLLPSQAAGSGNFDTTSGTAMGDVTGDGYDDMLFTYIDTTGGLGATRTTGIIDGATGSFLPGHRHPGFLGTQSQWGKTVCVIGDLDGDGAAEYAISDPYHKLVKVYWGDSSYGVFGDNLLCTIKQAEGSDSLFGNSLSMGGDLNGDGVLDLLIGDKQVQLGGGNDFVHVGAVYLISGYELTEAYKVAAGSSPLVPPVILSTTNMGRISLNRSVTGVQNLGQSIAGGTDVTGDGYPDILIKAGHIDFVLGSGAPTQSGVLFYSGRLTSRPIHTFTSPPPVTLPDGSVQDHSQAGTNNFGGSISFMLDVEGIPGVDVDSGIAYAAGDILIGHPGLSFPQGDPGFAFVFSSANFALLEVQKGTTTAGGTTQTGSLMGAGMASAGDVNGDGKGDYFVTELRWRAQGDGNYQNTGRGRVILIEGGRLGAIAANSAPVLDTEQGTTWFAQYGLKFASSEAWRVYIPNSTASAPGFMTLTNETAVTSDKRLLGSIEYH